MDIKNFLENFATTKSWRFTHARRDYQNLHDVLAFVGDEVEGFEDNETCIFLDPVTRSKSSTDSIVYTGNFMVLTKSNFDMTYKDRFDTYIKPALDIINDELYNALRCEFDINQWSTVEVINMFDFNADGVNVQFNLKGY